MNTALNETRHSPCPENVKKRHSIQNSCSEIKNDTSNLRKKTKNLRKLSHSLSWALRHAGPELQLTMTPDGFCPVQEILECSHPKLKGCWSLQDIQQVVETNDKQRFQLELRPARDYRRPTTDGAVNGASMASEENILCIRANQGHSIKGIDPNLLLRRLSPEELAELPMIVHGTYSEPWKTIQQQGLSKMKRNHIHFASGVPNEGNAVISGMRRSCTVIIYLDAAKCAQDGIEFFTSDNGVILTAGLENKGILPVIYFSHVTDSEGNILLDQRMKEAP